MSSPTLASLHQVTIEVGEIPIVVRTDSPEFARLLEARYGEFAIRELPHAAITLDIELINEPAIGAPDSDAVKDDDVSVRLASGHWIIERGDFHAEWNPQSRQGRVRQSPSPYGIDGVLRILHSLILAREGGFLVHAASAVRNGQAFAFAGVSGAGKTTLARLAPPDVTLLTDEVSYVRPTGRRQVAEDRNQEAEARSQQAGHRSQDTEGWSADSEERIPDSESQIPCPESRSPSPVSRISAFDAFGTPFAGELARIGQKVRASLQALFLLQQGAENRIEPISEAQAVRELLRHVLFFARDEELVGMVFQTVCDFVRCVPVSRVVFTPDARVWELIA